MDFHKTRWKYYTEKGVTVKSINQCSYWKICHMTVYDNDVEQIESSREIYGTIGKGIMIKNKVSKICTCCLFIY